MYIFIKSDDSSKIHKDNNSCEFVSDLARAINTSGDWSCALVDCDIGNNPKESLLVCCDIVESSCIHGKYLPVLSIVTKTGALENPYYMSISREQVHRVTIQLSTLLGEAPTDKPSISRFVLHFKKTN